MVTNIVIKTALLFHLKVHKFNSELQQMDFVVYKTHITLIIG